MGPWLERDVPERKTCDEDFDDVDELVELPDVPSVFKPNIVVDPIVSVIVLEPLVIVERIADVVMAEDECKVTVDV